MTAQAGDLFIYQKRRSRTLQEIPLAEHVIVPSPPDRPRTADAEICGSTACWRGYIATWRIRYGKLWLTDVVGQFMLANGPVRADWVTGRVRVPFGAMEEYVHSGYDSMYHNVVEFDIREGRVHRQRAFAVPTNEWSTPWLDDPSTSGLFASPSSVELEPPDPKPPVGDRVRRACRAARLKLGLEVGELVASAGLSPRRAFRVGEWEAGTRGLDPAFIDAIGARVGIDAVARARMDAEDEAEAAVAIDAFLDTRIRPTLVLLGRQQEQYALPAGIRASRTAAIHWAKLCVDACWSPALLWVSRRERYSVDLDGECSRVARLARLADDASLLKPA